MISKSHPEDIVAFLKEVTATMGDEFDLSCLRAGDRLYIRTDNTGYLFKVLGANRAEMVADRPDRPSGLVRIDGCVFGSSSLSKPDHVFCGGNLSILLEHEHKRYTTSPVHEIRHLACSP